MSASASFVQARVVVQPGRPPLPEGLLEAGCGVQRLGGPAHPQRVGPHHHRRRLAAAGKRYFLTLRYAFDYSGKIGLRLADGNRRSRHKASVYKMPVGVQQCSFTPYRPPLPSHSEEAMIRLSSRAVIPREAIPTRSSLPWKRPRKSLKAMRSSYSPTP